MKKIKMIWDFRGPDALKTAEHQCVHLKDFFIKDKIEFYQIEILRKTLKPNRGQLA